MSRFIPTLMAKIVLQSTAAQGAWLEIMNVEQPMKWVQPAANAKSKLTVSEFLIIKALQKPNIDGL